MPARAIMSELSAVMEADTSWILSDLLSAVTMTSSINDRVSAAKALDTKNDEIAIAQAILFLFILKNFIIISPNSVMN